MTKVKQGLRSKPEMKTFMWIYQLSKSYCFGKDLGPILTEFMFAHIGYAKLLPWIIKILGIYAYILQ